VTILDPTGRGFARKSKASLFGIGNLENMHIYDEKVSEKFH